MIVLGLDIGTKRTGIALASGPYARELMTLPTDDRLIANLQKICLEERVGKIIVGLPLQPDGTLSAQAVWVKKKIDDLARFINLPIEMEDEQLTSAEAQRVMVQMGLSGQAIEQRIDQYAAQLILQQYLNR